jgi:hypothetical protein
VRPQKAGKRRFLENIHRRGGSIVKITTLIIVLLGLATGTGVAMVASVHKEPGSAGLRGSKLLTIRLARVVAGATVFIVGVLAGAGAAAWMIPPV